jgi:hypothetical protein
MEIYNDIICITYSELLEIRSEIYIKKLISNNKINRIRRACKNTEALIEFDSMPEVIRKRYVSKYGDPHAAKKEEEKQPELLMDDKAYEYYSKTYRYAKNGVWQTMDADLAKQYTINATIIERVIKTLRMREMLTKQMKNTRRNIWPTIAVEYENWRTEYGHTLPNSLNRLKEKVRLFKKEGYKSLISGKLGNNSTQKIGEKEAKLIISLRRSSTPVYNEMQIFEEFNKQAEKRGFKPIKSQQTIHIFLNKPEIQQLWADAAYGELRLHQIYDRNESTQLPKMRDALWYGDGTKLNLYYKEISSTGKMTVMTTSVYEVIDAYSEVLLGYHISETENFEQQYNALRMAVTESGHRPFEIVNDNQGSHNKTKTKEFFESICRVHRATSPYRGQAKTIESIFGRFQSQVLHKHFNFTGQNVTTVSMKSKPNLERISANKDLLPTFAELKMIYAQARIEWNEMHHPATGISRIEMYQKSVNDQSPAITQLEMINIFWIMTEKPVTFTADGIIIQVHNQKYQYEVFQRPGVPDLKWRRYNTFRKFYVKYDPADMSVVQLYDEDKRYCCDAQPYLKIHRAIQEQTTEDIATIHMMTKLEKEERIDRQVTARKIAREFGTDYTQQGLNAPPLKGLNKDENYEVERRLNSLQKKNIDVEVGKMAKEVSNLDFNEFSEIKLNDDENAALKIANKY